MNQDQVKVVFFDIGGVLLTNGWGHQSRQAAAKHFGFDYDEMNYLHDFIFNIYEIGRINLDEYLNTVLFYQPRGFSKEELTAFMMRQSQELPATLPWLLDWKRKLRSDVKVISINNEGKELNDHRIKTFGLRRFFDAFVSSCEVGMRKPDPGIFQLALGIAQADPGQCLYFDDRPMLVEAAKKTGIMGHVHRDFESTKAILETLIQ